ncbi:MAG: glycosyltransferase family 9 protein [Candidatus Zixiibacteriota bacterium]
MERLKPLEHWFKAVFFRIFSVFLKRGRKGFQPIDGDSIKRIIFLRPEKIGDMVISLPVFDGLTKAYPNIRVSVLGSPRNRVLIAEDARFEKLFMYTKNVWKDFFTLLSMRRERYDCVVDMICDDSVTTLFLSQMIAAGSPRIGIGKRKYRAYYDYNDDHRMGDTGHIIENTLRLLDAFGIDSRQVSGYAHPYISAQDEQRANEIMQDIRNGSRIVPCVGYNVSAGARTRIWPEEKSLELLRAIRNHDPACQVILLTVDQDRCRAERLRREFENGVHIVPPGLSLLAATALISRLELLISPDTSLIHIARSFKVPVVGLYSRFMKNFLLWKPFGQERGAVVSGNDDNIFDITVKQVFETFKDVYSAREPVR